MKWNVVVESCLYPHELCEFGCPSSSPENPDLPHGMRTLKMFSHMSSAEECRAPGEGLQMLTVTASHVYYYT